MFRARTQNSAPVVEPETGRPAGTGEEWLGRNRSSKRRLWERLNPLSRKQIRVIAEALALQQIVSVEPLGKSRFRLVLQIPNQAAIDQSIDGLRTSGISIEELVRRRDTLEEAFLDIVAKSS